MQKGRLRPGEVTPCYHGYLVTYLGVDETVFRSGGKGANMQTAQLIVTAGQGGTASIGRCSLCNETFSSSQTAATDPLVAQRDLRNVFDAHVREKHSWRADANQTAAMRLRKIMEDLENAP